MPVLLLLAALVALLVITMTPTEASIPISGPIKKRFIGIRIPDDEAAIILAAADRFRIDPRLLGALRLTERGGPGREFGVLSVDAPTFEAQAEVAARSIYNAEGRYLLATGMAPRVDGFYTRPFIQFFSARYAPVGAANDPGGLNVYHFGNLLAFYDQADVVAV